MPHASPGGGSRVVPQDSGRLQDLKIFSNYCEVKRGQQNRVSEGLLLGRCYVLVPDRRRSPDEDGKGKSIWDTYAHTPGKIKDGVHRRRRKRPLSPVQGGRQADAVDLERRRTGFSIAWPRIFPERDRPAERQGPRLLQPADGRTRSRQASSRSPRSTTGTCRRHCRINGGWQSRDTARAFADYAGHVAEKLSDRVRHFFTINEFHIVRGHGLSRSRDRRRRQERSASKSPPGLKLPAGRTEPGAAPRCPRPRHGRPGDPSEGKEGDQVSVRQRTCHDRRPADRIARAHQGGRGGNARTERRLHDGACWRASTRDGVPEGSREGRPEVHAMRT